MPDLRQTVIWVSSEDLIEDFAGHDTKHLFSGLEIAHGTRIDAGLANLAMVIATPMTSAAARDRANPGGEISGMEVFPPPPARYPGCLSRRRRYC